jgi:CHAT domain-containing protein/Tfp pilus assembly protein PilF
MRTMFARMLTSIVVALAALYLCCNLKSGESPDAAQGTAANTPSLALADRYVTQAESLIVAAQFDSAIVFLDQASQLYEAAGSWEKYVSCYNAMGKSFRRKGAFEESMNHLNHALEVGRSKLGEQHREISNVYNGIGLLQKEKGDINQALESFHKALAILSATLQEGDSSFASIYNNIGAAYHNSGDYNKALSFYERALAIDSTIRGIESTEVAVDYTNMGATYRLKGDYDHALLLLEKALVIKLATIGDQNRSTAVTYFDTAQVYNDKGDYDKAIEYFNKALSIFQKTLGEQHPDIAGGHYSIGGVYTKKGAYNAALEHYQQALTIALSTLGEQHHRTAFIYNSMGSAYSDLGLYDQALALFEKSLAIKLVRLGENVSTSNTYAGMALAYHKKGDYRQALAYYDKALAIRQARLGAHHLQVALIYNNMGDVYQDQGAYDKAIFFYENALDIKLDALGNQHPVVALTYNNMGKVEWKKGNYNIALDLYQKALQANIPGFNPDDSYENPVLEDVSSEKTLLESLSSKAGVLATRNNSIPSRLDLDAALATYDLAAALTTQMRRGYQTEDSKLFLTREAATIFEQALQTTYQLFLATGDNTYKQTAFLFSEKSKSGILLDALAETHAQRFAGIPGALLQQEQQLRIDLAGYEISLAQELDASPEERDSTKIAFWQAKLFDLRQAHQALLERFENGYPAYYNLKYQPQKISVGDVQRLLDAHTTLVSYFVGAQALYIFTLTSKTFEATPVPLTTRLDSLVNVFRQSMVAKDDTRYVATAYRLYQLLLGPVLPLLRTEHLIIVPDGPLHHLPFDALLTRDLSQGSGLVDYSTLPYLLRTHSIRYAYSATLLNETIEREREVPSRDFLAFAPVFPGGLASNVQTRTYAETVSGLDATWQTRAGNGALPGTRREVTSIKNLFDERVGFFTRLLGQRTKVYLEAQARETRIKQPEVARYRYVHLATHGFASEQESRLSRLQFFPEDSTAAEDGALYLGEVYNLRLNADLVVLSACETGLGQWVQGEGIIGLTRGFLYAGAQRVMVSLWKPSDAITPDLMRDFYGGLLDGASHAAALRTAKLRMIQQKDEAALPFFWAPFVLIGQ